LAGVQKDAAAVPYWAAAAARWNSWSLSMLFTYRLDRRPDGNAGAVAAAMTGGDTTVDGATTATGRFLRFTRFNGSMDVGRTRRRVGN